MQVVNIRQLNNNPATALRGAKEDDVVVRSRCFEMVPFPPDSPHG